MQSLIPKKAIEKAIAGGWKVGHGAFVKCKNPTETLEMFNFCYPTQESIDQHRHYFEYSLDKTFWQALGKSCGWKLQGIDCPVCDNYPNQHSLNADFNIAGWLYNAHRFYDLILTGGDTEKFWEEILSATKEI